MPDKPTKKNARRKPNTKAKVSRNPSISILKGGIPDWDPADLKFGDTLDFVNETDTDFLIEFWTKQNDKHAPICLLLSAGSTVTIMADPFDHVSGDKAKYSIIRPYQKARRSRRRSGGHSIIIG